MTKNEYIASIMLEAADLLNESSGRNGAYRRFREEAQKNLINSHNKNSKKVRDYTKLGYFDKLSHSEIMQIANTPNLKEELNDSLEKNKKIDTRLGERVPYGGHNYSHDQQRKDKRNFKRELNRLDNEVKKDPNKLDNYITEYKKLQEKYPVHKYHNKGGVENAYMSRNPKPITKEDGSLNNNKVEQKIHNKYYSKMTTKPFNGKLPYYQELGDQNNSRINERAERKGLGPDGHKKGYNNGTKSIKEAIDVFYEYASNCDTLDEATEYIEKAQELERVLYEDYNEL